MYFIAGIIFSVAVVGQYRIGASSAKTASVVDSIAQNSKTMSAPDFQKRVRFSGEAFKGQSFERQIDRDLFFRLVPEELGWTISVGSNTGPRNNFCGVVTPPYRGVNQIYIDSWHFRGFFIGQALDSLVGFERPLDLKTLALLIPKAQHVRA